MFQALKKSVRSLAICSLAIVSSLSSAYADEANTNAQGKTLNVGCEGAFAPFTYIDDQGNITGFDIDLIKAIGKDLGYNVKINVMPFDGLIPSLMTGNIDLIISGFTISEERAKKVDFSDPYYLCGMSYVIEKKNAQKYDTYEKLDGHPICTQLAATGTNFTQKFLQKSKDKIFNTPPETYIELGNGSCLAAIHDKPVNDFFLTKDKPESIEAIHTSKRVCFHIGKTGNRYQMHIYESSRRNRPKDLTLLGKCDGIHYPLNNSSMGGHFCWSRVDIREILYGYENQLKLDSESR